MGSGNGVIAVTNSDTTIVNGFTFDNYRAADNDGDGDLDMVEVLEAEMAFLTGGGSDRLTISGTCPGGVVIEGTGFAPGESVAVYRGIGSGAAPVPGGPCAGTTTGFGSLLKFHGTASADATGTVTISPTVPAPACGQAMQMQSMATCGFTNVAPFP